MSFVLSNASIDPAFHLQVSMREDGPVARLLNRARREVMVERPLDVVLRIFSQKERSTLVIAVTLEDGAAWPKTAPTLWRWVPA